MTVALRCPVRSCGETLERHPRLWRCPRGHTFDLARSGYCNLLQPQERRSARPGDSSEAVAARRRLAEAGFAAHLHETLRAEIGTLGLGADAAVLDLGCGEGSFLGGLVRDTGWEGHGLDLSAEALDLAARRHPEATWIVANADRSLPYAASSFDLVTSLDARLHPEEIRRVLRPSGTLLVAVPAADDLAELRRTVLGPEEGEGKDRLTRAEGLLAERFEVVRRLQSRTTQVLSPERARDALIATYRAGRASREPALEALGTLEVTLAHEVGVFRPRLDGSATPTGQAPEAKLAPYRPPGLA